MSHSSGHPYLQHTRPILFSFHLRIYPYSLYTNREMAIPIAQFLYLCVHDVAYAYGL